MSEAVEVLRQFKGFSYFTEMSDIINRLEDHVASARMKTTPVIDFEKNESLKGLDYLDTIYHAIVNEHPIQLKYRSFKARSANSFIFYPYLLKEYRNRWFVYGVRGNGRILQNLALDRIQSLEVLPQEHYIKNTFFDPNTFFDDLVGVTKNTGSVAEKVGFKVAAAEAPYIITKPIHRSQQVMERLADGSVILEIEVVINHELERVFFGYAEGIQVLYPKTLVELMGRKLKRLQNNIPIQNEKGTRSIILSTFKKNQKAWRACLLFNYGDLFILQVRLSHIRTLPDKTLSAFAHLSRCGLRLQVLTGE